MGTLLRDTRERRGVGVREFARLCGVSAPTVLGWESSEAVDTIQLGTLHRALNALGEEVEVSVRRKRPDMRTLDRREQRLGRELHRKVAGHLIDDPRRILDLARERIPLLRTSVRGGAVSWVDEWERLIDQEDIGRLVDTFLGVDQHDIDMRSVSPFDNLLNDNERREVLTRAST